MESDRRGVNRIAYPQLRGRDGFVALPCAIRDAPGAGLRPDRDGSSGPDTTLHPIMKNMHGTWLSSELAVRARFVRYLLVAASAASHLDPSGAKWWEGWTVYAQKIVILHRSLVLFAIRAAGASAPHSAALARRAEVERVRQDSIVRPGPGISSTVFCGSTRRSADFRRPSRLGPGHSPTRRAAGRSS